MSGWRALLKEESEHQWLSFAIFSALIIIGAVMIDWSNELSGVTSGSSQGSVGMVVDAENDAFIFDDKDGRWVSLRGEVASANNAECISGGAGLTFFCSGQTGVLFTDQGDGWKPFGIGAEVTVDELAVNGDALMMIIEDGAATTLMARWLPDEIISEPMAHEGDMILTEVIATDDGWLAAGSWRAPSSDSGSNPASSTMHEVVIAVTWDGTTSPPVHEIVHLGGIGVVHTLAKTSEGVIAAGQNDAVLFKDGEKISLDMPSLASASDSNGDVWFFGALGSTTVAVYTEDGIEISQLPSPLAFNPVHASSQGDDIAIHGIGAGDEIMSMTIDVNARLDFTSLRGMLDLAFILIGTLVLGVMAWNITDAIRRNEVF